MKNLLTFIVPVKNEYENVKILLTELKMKVKSSYSSLLVYDEENSIIEKLKQEIKDKNIIFLKNKYNKGFSNAIKTGIDYVNTDFFIVMMADNSDDVKQCDYMLNKAMEENLDIVVPSRFIEGGKYIGGNFIKKTISKFAGKSLFYLRKSSIFDITNNYRLYRTSKIKNIEIKSDLSFDIAMELTVKTYINGGKMSEIPTCWRERKVGKSKFHFSRHVVPYLRWYLLALNSKN